MTRGKIGVKSRLLATLATWLLAGIPAFGGVPAPTPSIRTLKELPVTISAPYNEAANADRAVADALRKAKAEHKRVLLDLGGNWCPDCIVFANFLQLPEIRQFVASRYVVVPVNVGRFNTNLQIAAKFGYTTRLKGVPTILVVTPDGHLVNRGDVFAITDARHMTPRTLADYLAKYAAP